jgi:hypothetical protein
MPLVHAYVGPRFDRADALKRACWQIVPAAYSTEQGPQNPGSIFFLHHATTYADDMMGDDGLAIDVLLDVEAYDLPDRADTEGRAAAIKDALTELFPGFRFAVFLKLVKAGYASDVPDPDFDGDLSMPAAITRAREVI